MIALSGNSIINIFCFIMRGTVVHVIENSIFQ